jgi:transposase
MQRRSLERNDLKAWRRATAVLGYLDGEQMETLAQQLGVNNSTVSRWLSAYVARGVEALTPRTAPGPQRRLTEEQMKEVGELVEQGPEAAGFSTGVWTARMVGELIRDRFGVTYHWKYVPELLHQLGFSVQRPRKRLSRADRDAQEHWLRHTLPRLKKKPGE